jgi:hypothetical protein
LPAAWGAAALLEDEFLQRLQEGSRQRARIGIEQHDHVIGSQFLERLRKLPDRHVAVLRPPRVRAREPAGDLKSLVASEEPGEELVLQASAPRDEEHAALLVARGDLNRALVRRVGLLRVAWIERVYRYVPFFASVSTKTSDEE